MTNLRARMMSQTADLRSASDIQINSNGKPKAPRTGPGMVGALAVAQERIAELEKAGSAMELSIVDIVPNPWQPRRVFNEAKLTQLAEAIRETGLMQPIVVRWAENCYQIVAGERRWRAHKMIGKETIKAVVIKCADEDMAMLALVENVLRDDLTDYEISRSIRGTEKEFPNRTRMAEALGVSRSGLYRYLSYAELPDFIVRDLDVQPRVLGATAAEDTVKTIKSLGEKAVEAARILWPQVVIGELDQSQLAKMVKKIVESGSDIRAVNDRNIEKIFSGKSQAGSITKDASGFMVKIKAGMLTLEKEKQIRTLITQLFSSNI